MRNTEVNLTKEKFNEICELVKNVYNITIVIDYFISNQQHIEECYNLAPVVQLLHTNADLLNAFFINEKSKLKNNTF